MNEQQTKNRPLGRLALIGLVVALSGTGCGDDASGDTDTDGDTETSSTSTSTSSGPSTTASTSTTTSTTTSSSSSTTDEPTSTVTSETGTTDPTETGDESTTGEPLPGVCVGIDQIATFATVHSMNPPPQMQCDPMPDPCGGDIVGAWTVDGSCGTPLGSLFPTICEGATEMVTGATVVGTRTFNADLSVVIDTTRTIDLDVQLDSMDCAGVGCEAFGEALSEEDNLTLVCEDGDGSQCNCLVEIEEVIDATGTYEIVAEGFVVVTLGGQDGAPSQYCVGDNRLDMWDPVFGFTPFEEIGCADAEDCSDALGNASEFYSCDLDRK